MAHHICFRVYYEDTDAGGIVYHARYLGFAERARAEALRALGLEVGVLARQEDTGFIVRTITVRYHAPLMLDDLFRVETCLIEQKASSLHLLQKIVNLSKDEDLSVTLNVELVCLQMSRMKPMRIPVTYRPLLQQLSDKLS